MRHFNPAKKGQEVPTNALYGKMYEYYDQGLDQSPCLVKRIVVQDKSKLGQYIHAFTVGFTNSHPSIFKFKGFSVQEEPEGTVFYIFQKALKKNLKQYIQEKQGLENQGYLPLEKIVGILYQLASALAYLEDNDIVHSNITHDSVLLDDDNDNFIKLTGFLLSKLEILASGRKERSLSYWPPERKAEKSNEPHQQAENEEELEKKAKYLALKADVFCLGKLIIDLCLLQDKIVKQTTYFQINKKVREDLVQVEEKYGKSLADILRLLLNPEPEKRISFHEICDQLNEKYFDEVRLLPYNILRGFIIEEHMKTLTLPISHIEGQDQLDDDHHAEQEAHENTGLFANQDTLSSSFIGIQSLLGRVLDGLNSINSFCQNHQELQNAMAETTQTLKTIKSSLVEWPPNNPQQSLSLNSSKSHETSLHGFIPVLERSVETLSEILEKSKVSDILNTSQSFEVVGKSLTQVLSEFSIILPNLQNLSNISINQVNAENNGSQYMAHNGINSFNQTVIVNDSLTKKDQISEVEESATNHILPLQNNEEVAAIVQDQSGKADV